MINKKETYLKGDFNFSTTLYQIEELISEEEQAEGIEPFALDFDVAISSHADIQRKKRNKERNNDFVEVTHEDIYEMVRRYGWRLHTIENYGEFSVIDSKLGIGIVGVLHQNFPNSLIIIKTILNNENIYISRGTNTLDIENGKITQGYISKSLKK